MTFKIFPKSGDWWFWLVTWALILAALAGLTPAYYGVVAVSLANAAAKANRKRSLTAFAVQTRIVYLALTLPGLWPEVRFWWYLAMFAGTTLVVFFDRCTIALVLKKAPWNRDRPLLLN
ncbi:MAG: hypothetical protein OEN55_07945 [Alphaproteobacteria bacterium]|nr:hypothetical protein [Alphaproteobacteria bacterium]